MLTLDDKVKVIRLNEKGDISRVLATNFEVGKTDKFHNQEQSRNIKKDFLQETRNIHKSGYFSE